MLLGFIKLFGPGITDLLRVMWSPEDGGGAGGSGSGTGGNEGGGAGANGAGSGSGESVEGQQAGQGQEGQVTELQAALGRLVEVYRGLPDVVPDMISGATVAELEASLERSRNAFKSLAAKLVPSGAETAATSAGQATGQQVTPAPVPVSPGAAGGRVVEEKLTATEKIMRGLESRGRASR